MNKNEKSKDSKTLIFKGLHTLLNKKNYHELTITEIAKEAGVSRQTIHRYFRNKDEIIIFAVKKELDNIFKLKKQQTDFFIKDLFSYHFQMLKENPGLHKVFEKSELKTKIITIIQKEIEEKFKDIIPDIKDYYYKAFLFDGLSAVMKSWMLNGMQESPKYMGEKTAKILEDFFWWSS